MQEVLTHYRPADRGLDGLGRLGLEPDQYYLVSAHREENVDPTQALSKLVARLNAVAEDWCLPVVVSAHPRTRKRIDGSEARFRPVVRFLKPLASTIT